MSRLSKCKKLYKDPSQLSTNDKNCHNKCSNFKLNFSNYLFII